MLREDPELQASLDKINADFHAKQPDLTTVILGGLERGVLGGEFKEPAQPTPHQILRTDLLEVIDGLRDHFKEQGLASEAMQPQIKEAWKAIRSVDLNRTGERNPPAPENYDDIVGGLNDMSKYVRDINLTTKEGEAEIVKAAIGTEAFVGLSALPSTFSSIGRISGYHNAILDEGAALVVAGESAEYKETMRQATKDAVHDPEADSEANDYANRVALHMDKRIDSATNKIEKMNPEEQQAYKDRYFAAIEKMDTAEKAYAANVTEPGRARLDVLEEKAAKVDAKAVELAKDLVEPAPAQQAELTQKPVQPAPSVPTGPT